MARAKGFPWKLLATKTRPSMTAMPGGLKKPEQPPDMVLIHRPVLA
jgi:hypothetical protein